MQHDPMNLSGRLIVVTGASSGIGRETAILISELGGKVALVARSEEKLNATLASLSGEGHEAYPFDLSDTAGIKDLIAQIVARQGKAGGLAYCAGVSGSCPLKMLKKERLIDTLNVNLFGFIEMCRVLSGVKMRTETASLVGVSSLSSRRGEGGMTAYCASKAGMDGAVRAMAHELAPAIRVNTVQPGWTDTEMLRSVVEQNGTARMDRETSVLQYMGVVPPRCVAESIAFLLSDSSRFITGNAIGVDGGYFS